MPALCFRGRRAVDCYNSFVKTNRRVFLVGMMGAGKTTVGRQLAKRLGKTFYDADREIEVRTGVAVAVIFDIEGEAGFRKREAETIEQLTALDDIVLASSSICTRFPRCSGSECGATRPGPCCRAGTRASGWNRCTRCVTRFTARSPTS